MTINFRLLFIVLSLGILLIVVSEFLNQDRWAWLTHPSIPEETAEIRPLEQRVFYPKLDKDALNSILDNSYWSKEDYKSWKNMIEILRDTSQSELNKYSFGRVTYVQLKSQSKAFRGILVNVKGNVWQCVPIKQNSKDVNIPYIYQIALSPDSSPSEPVIINALEIPEGFPTGEEIEPQRIDCTGFYFKNWVYPSKNQNDILSAPLIMSKSFNWIPPLKPEKKQNPPYLLIILATFAAAMVIFWLINYYIEQNAPPKPPKMTYNPPQD